MKDDLAEILAEALKIDSLPQTRSLKAKAWRFLRKQGVTRAEAADTAAELGVILAKWLAGGKCEKTIERCGRGRIRSGVDAALKGLE